MSTSLSWARNPALALDEIHDADAARLVELVLAAHSRDRSAGDHAACGTLRPEHIAASLAAHAVVEEAERAFQQRYYPRASRVIASTFGVMVGKDGMTSRFVWPVDLR